MFQQPYLAHLVQEKLIWVTKKKGNKKSSNRMQFGNNFPKVCCHNTQLSPMLHAVTPTPRQLPQIAAARN